MKRLTLEQVRYLVEDARNHEYVLLSDYVNYQTKIQILHKECGTIFEVTPNNFIGRGDGCPNHDCRQKRVKAACLAKYGYENPSQVPEIKKQREETCLKLYGYKTSSQNPQVIERAKQNNIAKYGVPCTLQTESVKEKTRQTCLQRWGVNHHSQATEIKEKKKQTCLEHYGVEYSLAAPEVRRQIDQTIFETYGVAHVSQINFPDWLKPATYNNEYLAKLGEGLTYNEFVKKYKEWAGPLNRLLGTINKKIHAPSGFGTSWGEREIANYLDVHGISYEQQYWFDDLRGEQYTKRRPQPLYFDFAILNEDNSIKFLIEYDGEQHFDTWWFDSKRGDDLKARQARDEKKNQYCLDHNIILHRIPYWEYDNLPQVLDKLFSE